MEVRVLPPPASTGMRMIKLLDINAYAAKRNNAPVTSLLKDAAITITNTAREVRGLNYESLKLYYLDETDRRWKPVASQFNATTLTLTAATNHFSYYGEQADPAIAGPAMIMGFEANLHSGTVKTDYPIELPPAPGGFKPRLNLVYDSGRADGMKNKRSLGSWAGIGWSLHPGYISYDEEANEYYMEVGGLGYEIFRSSDSYFTKPDLFYKIVRDEANQKWEVWDRGGVYYRFGGASDSKQYYDKSGSPLFYRWDLSLMQDTHSTSNQATVSYNQYVWNSSVRSAYPSQMTYSGGQVTVTFNSSYYQNTADGLVRRDNPLSTAGYPVPKVMDNRQLDNIEIKVGGVLTRKYTFAYATTDRVSSSDYGGIYYAGKHQLDSVTQIGADGSSALPAMTFSYQDLATFFRDADGPYYNGNPGNAADLYWPRLSSANNGYGATVTFSYTQTPTSSSNNVWTRQVVTGRTINAGIGPNQTYTYTYDGSPEYLGSGWTARYRGFRKVKETDAAGNYAWRYFHTTGYDSASGKDWEKITGREYKTRRYDAGGNLVQETVNNWLWDTTSFWDSANPKYTFLTRWDGYGTNDGYFNGPWGVAVSSGNVYVVDRGNSRVEKFDSNGAFVTRWGESGNQNNQFNNPQGIAASNDGKVYVADASNGRVQKFADYAPFVASWSAGASGVAVSPDSAHVYVVSSANHQVVEYTSTGQQLASWGSQGSADGQFQSPYGIAVDSSGYVYVADTGNHRVQKFTSSGTFVSKFGSSGTGNEQFASPHGLTVDSSGNIFVADTGNHRIQKFNSSYNFLWNLGKVDGGGNPVSGSGNGEFNSPRGVAALGASYVFVSDEGNNRVQKISAAGAYNAQWGAYASGNGRFSTVEDVAQYNNADVYVVDSGLHEVKKFDAEGKYLARFGVYGTGDGQFNAPKGIGIGVEGSSVYVYVVDTGNNRIQKFNSSGGFVAKWGSPGSGNSQFASPEDVAVSYDGAYVYVADTGNHRIQKFDSAGNYVSQWGSYGTGNEQFNLPTGVAVDYWDLVYVVDSGNNRVKTFSSGGAYQGQWGGAGQLNSPTKVAVDGAAPGVYVVDKGNHRIRKYTNNGTFITQFGVQGTDNGAFSSPKGIDVSFYGDFIFVADTGNNRLQKLTWQWNVYLYQTDVTTGGKTQRTRYTPDMRGNIYTIYNYGDISTADDDATTYRLFSWNTAAWILDKMKRERTYSGIKTTDDAGDGLKAESRYFYDGNASYTEQPTKGDLTKLEKYDPASQGAVNWQKTYDSYGNVLTETDANGRTTDYLYDSTYHTFVTKKTLPLVSGQAQRMEDNYAWNYTGARMTSETDVNGQTTSYEYDTFWRPTKLIRPGDSSGSPTIQHQYQNWGTINQQHIYSVQKIDGSSNLWGKKYFDGLGRVAQVQAKGETDRTIVTTTTFSDRGLVDREYIPQDLASTSLSGYKAAETAWRKSTFQYDALRRLTGRTNADNTTIAHVYTDWQDTATNERGKKKRYDNDAFGRLTRVEELDDAFAIYAATTYKYDVLNNLIEVKDSANNTTVINYNGFSRKTSMTDPDMGLWSYQYDSQGNLTSQTDAKNQALTFLYDELSRLKEKKSSGNTLATYSYDDVSSGNYGKGRRTGMSDSSGSLSYKYDARGRLVEEKRTVDGTPYTTSYTYDSADRQVTVSYPTGETVTQTYNGRGLLSGLSSSVNGTIVSSTQYNSNSLVFLKGNISLLTDSVKRFCLSTSKYRRFLAAVASSSVSPEPSSALF
ncbi:MAG: SMP-30/gluconolactonase/LRE family protein [Chloroflexi bacterium]|nr:SMP-30/gluconolactonase/LRE family protein [Chloroflexota bacterium]